MTADRRPFRIAILGGTGAQGTGLAKHLSDLDDPIDCDVLVCGDDPTACEVAIGLCRDIGVRGLYAGRIANSVAVEALTSVLIQINRRYRVPSGSGIRITGTLCRA